MKLYFKIQSGHSKMVPTPFKWHAKIDTWKNFWSRIPKTKRQEWC